jgi:hypothetical protein
MMAKSYVWFERKRTEGVIVIVVIVIGFKAMLE